MSRGTKRRNEYLKPAAFVRLYPARASQLQDSTLKKHVSWVLIDRESSSKAMTYMLMSSTAYARACAVAATKTSAANVSMLERRLNELEEDNADLDRRVDELATLDRIRSSLEARSAALDRDQQAATQLIAKLHQLEETVRLQNPKLAATIRGNLESILDMPPNARSREVMSR